MIVVSTPTGDIHQVLGRLPTAVQGRAQVVEGSHGDPEVVDRAFNGAAAVFWFVPPDPKAESVEAAYVGFSRPASEAISRHGVERKVTVSALGRGTAVADHAGYVTGSLAMDNLLRQAQLIKD